MESGSILSLPLSGSANLSSSERPLKAPMCKNLVASHGKKMQQKPHTPVFVPILLILVPHVMPPLKIMKPRGKKKVTSWVT